MTAIGSLNNIGNSLNCFLYFNNITAPIFCLVALIGLMLLPLLSHGPVFSELEDAVTSQLVMKTTNVSVVSFAVAVSVGLTNCLITWFYPTNCRFYLCKFSSTFNSCKKIFDIVRLSQAN